MLTGIDGSTPSGIVNTLDTPGYSAHQYSYLAKNNGSKLFDNGTSKKVWYSTPIN